MKESQKMVLIVICSFFMFMIPFAGAFADDDNHKDDNKRYRKISAHDDKDDHDDDRKSKYLAPVNNETFKQECGACHFAYQPGLLPAGSWEKILNNLPSHFGEEVSLTGESKNIISQYLLANSAERSSAKRARKILKSLGGQTPMRITETPYIREKHHELDANIFSREPVGSRSNCIACHPAAEQGNYDDDLVKIPK